MDVYKSSKGRDMVYHSYACLLKTWDICPEERDIETPFGKTHLILAGDSGNPPLILFHGAGDNSALVWSRNIPALSERFFCVGVDMLGGAGKSVPNDRYRRAFSLTDWFYSVLGAVPELTDKKVNIAGVSYGSYQAQLFGIHCPDRVEKIVAIAAYPSAAGYKLGVLKRMLAIFFPEALFPVNKNLETLVKKLYGPRYTPDAVDAEVMRHFKILFKKYNNAFQRYQKRELFTKEQFGQIRDRALFLVGDCDNIAFFPEAQRAIRELDLHCAVYPDGGHMLNYQFPKEVNSDIVDFILG